MLASRLILAASLVLAAGTIPTRAIGADAGHAWGTISSPGIVLLNSAQTHEQGALSAQLEAAGKPAGGSINGGGFPAVTSCGTCTTITIQGNNNSISGTSITSTNSGTVTSNGQFNE